MQKWYACDEQQYVNMYSSRVVLYYKSIHTFIIIYIVSSIHQALLKCSAKIKECLSMHVMILITMIVNGEIKNILHRQTSKAIEIQTSDTRGNSDTNHQG